MAETSRVQSAQDLAVIVTQDPEVEQRIKGNAVAAIARVADNPLQADPITYRVVVIVLGVVLLVATCWAFFLTLYGVNIPDLLSALGSCCSRYVGGCVDPGGRR
jgi:hypothetical protein